MSKEIIQFDQAMFETKLDTMVREKVERIVNAMLDAEADEIANAARYDVYGQINVYGVTTKSERHKRSYWTRTADGNGIGGRKAPVPYGS